ncbi:MAG: alpha/beta hydrolase [Bacteroidota bacterium]
MKTILLLSFLFAAISCVYSQDITGDWAGALSVRGVNLRIVFHIRQTEGKLVSTFDSPDQNALDLKIDETILNGRELTLSAPSMGITYRGNFTAKRDSIDGNWIQGKNQLPLMLTRQQQEIHNTPANPHETAIILNTATGEIKGTLTMPESRQQVPLVLIIAGSGPTDRDGNSPPALKNSSNCYKMLAEELRKKGIASVRYDKRGIGASAAAGKKEHDLRFEDYVSDARGWISLLSHDKRFSAIIVAGHSEGSLIGMIACANSGAKGYVSIAGSGRPADQILREQLSSLPKEMNELIIPMLEALKRGDTLASVPESMNSFFRSGIQPYLISWFRYDPQAEIVKLTIPVLILQGEMDIQVSAGDARLLARACPAASLKLIGHMNHVLKDTDTMDKMEQVKSVYTNSELPLDTTLTDEIITFVQKIK